jgi:hypothetical protein
MKSRNVMRWAQRRFGTRRYEVPLPSCGRERFMNLEIGVEDGGKNGRHISEPVHIPCDAASSHRKVADISASVHQALFPGMRYFNTRQRPPSACGIPRSIGNKADGIC